MEENDGIDPKSEAKRITMEKTSGLDVPTLIPTLLQPGPDLLELIPFCPALFCYQYTETNY